MITRVLAICAAAAMAGAAGGCGGTDTASGPSTATTTATMAAHTTTTAQDTTLHLHVTVRAGAVSGDVAPTVKRGSKVTIHVTSDEADEAHVHGYDKELALRPGREALIAFTADIPGRFEVELHHSGTKVMELTVK